MFAKVLYFLPNRMLSALYHFESIDSKQSGKIKAFSFASVKNSKKHFVRISMFSFLLRPIYSLKHSLSCKYCKQ